MKKKYYLMYLVLLVSLFTLGCKAKQPQTMAEMEAQRKQHLSIVTKVYSGKSIDDVLLAASKVFYLADEDYTVKHSTAGIQAQRNWLVYAVLAAASGIDTWTVNAEQVEEGIKVTVQHTGQSQAALFGMPQSSITLEASLYKLFFSRLDYLLGEKRVWITCGMAKKMFKGNLEPLCLVANDKSPFELPKK